MTDHGAEAAPNAGKWRRALTAVRYPIPLWSILLPAIIVALASPSMPITEALLVCAALCGVVVGYWDIGRRRSAQAELAHRAFHDPLTNLPNRALFLDRLGRALAERSRPNRTTTVMFLDLDDFKSVNDRYGHQVGDELLVAVADRLRACVRPSDIVARLGGDEFTLLLSDVADLGSATQIALRIAGRLEAPFSFDGVELGMTASIGVAIGLPGSDRPEDLLRDADRAMYRVKSSGKAGFAVFDLGPNGQEAGAVARTALSAPLGPGEAELLAVQRAS